MVFGVPNPAPDPKGPRDKRMGAVESQHWNKSARAKKISNGGWGKSNAILIGVDEAGRGPLAGPVSVAAAVFSPKQLRDLSSTWMNIVDDSKKLSEADRMACFEGIIEDAEAWAIAHVHAGHIDDVNILQATYHGMALVVDAIIGLESTWPSRPTVVHVSAESTGKLWYTENAPKRTHVICKPLGTSIDSARVLVDGNRPYKVAGDRAPVTQYPVVKGDALSYHIAAASVLAKVSRDAFMKKADTLWPAYGFAGHKGYPTKAHRTAVAADGACPIHRRSFKGVRDFVETVAVTRAEQASGGQNGTLL